MKKLFSILLLGAITGPAIAQWNNNTSVNLEVSTLNASDMKAVNTSDGKTWVAYYSSRGNNQIDMYAQLLDTAGNKLLGPNGIQVDTNASSSTMFVFNICTDSKGDLIIGMQDQRTGSGFSTVGYKIDQNGNSSWNNGNGVVLGTGLSPYVTALNSNEIVFAWLDNSGKIVFQKYASDGTPVWASSKELGTNSRRGQMVPLSDSGFVMVYQRQLTFSTSKPYAQRFNKNGDSVWASSVQLSDEITSPSRYYSITHEADTTYFGYYTSSPQNHFNAWVHRINPDGTLVYGGSGAAVSDYAANTDPHEEMTNIGLQPNSPYIWAFTSCTVTSPQVQWGIMTQKFDKTTGQRQLNTNGKIVYPLTASDQYAQQGGVTFKRQYPVFMAVSGVSYVIKGNVLNTAGDFLLPAQDLSSTVITQPSSLVKSRFSFTDMINSQSVAVWNEKRGAENKGYAQNFKLDMLDTLVKVTTVNNVPAVIDVFHGTLDMASAVLPAVVSQDVTWSVIPGTGAASISSTGVVTAIADGTVWAKATSNIASIYADSMQVTISNQDTSTGPNSISEVEKNIGFSAYPNPASNVLNLHIKAGHPVLDIIIVDLNGRVVLSDKVGANALNANRAINLKSFASGTYILQVKGEGLDIKKKFAKQ